MNKKVIELDTKVVDLDIIVPFNDVTISKDDSAKLGYNQKTYNGEDLSVVDQMTLMAETLKQSYKDKINYKLYASHSSNISKKSRARLVKAGYTILKGKEHYIPGRTSNKIYAYNNITDGDYSLIVDSDLLFIKYDDVFTGKTLAAQLRKNIPLWEGDVPPIFGDKSDIIWKHLYSKANIPLPEMETEYDFAGSCHYNNGAILIKNSYKESFKKIILECRDIIMEEFDELNKFPKFRHFLAEIIMSLALIKSGKCETLPSNFNVLTSEWSIGYDWNVVHYGAISNLNKFTMSSVVKNAIKHWDFNKN
jgi:hypothetical protein